MKSAFFFVLLFTIHSCSSSKVQKQDSDDFFEGEIIYTIDYKPYSDQFLAEGLKERIGSKMVLLFKGGNYLKKYYSSNGKLLSERFLDIRKNKSYMKSYMGNDTIYWVDVTRNDSKTTFRQIRDSIILEKPCIGIATETIVSGSGFGDKTFDLSGAYYFSRDLKIDPGWYTDYREGNFNEIVQIGKGIQLLYVDKGIYWEQTKTATSIKERSIDNNEISIVLTDDTILKEL